MSSDKLIKVIKDKLSSFLETWLYAFYEMNRGYARSIELIFRRKESYLLIFLEDLKTLGAIKGISYKSKWKIQIYIGDGNFEGLEYHWSGIQILSCSFGDMIELQAEIEKVIRILTTEHLDFLKGDLELFTKRRQIQAQNRKIDNVVIEDTKTGKFTMVPDVLQLQFKEKYS